jgi:hypothetical protein
MVFFLDAEEKIYARYGGRGPEGADARQSLEGLRYTMQSVLAMHDRADKSFAARSDNAPKFIRDVAASVGRRTGGCVHCHQVREVLNTDLFKKGGWSRDAAWRYPLPENLGIQLEIDRGNVVKALKDKDLRFVAAIKTAAEAGLLSGDVLRVVNRIPIHSFADVQFALDKAPRTGALDLAFQRGDETIQAKLPLPDGWRKTDLSWRPSMHGVIPTARLSGNDLGAEERTKLGLTAKQLAFRQKETIAAAVKEAGIQPGDVILGIDGREPEMDMIGFNRYVQTNYLVGDRVRIRILRDGKREEKEMVLRR